MKYKSISSMLVILVAIIVIPNCRRDEVVEPPATPAAPTGISHGGKGVKYEFAATTTDPVKDSIAIRFNWGDGDTSDWSSFVISNDTVKMAHIWADSGFYLIRVQAQDSGGLLSDWSEPCELTIRGIVPAVPTGPSQGFKSTDYEFLSSATDPDEDSVMIRFDWGDGDTSNWSSLISSDQVFAEEHAYRSAGTFDVRAQARGRHGQISGWSGASQMVVSNQPPDTPITPSGPSSGWPDTTFGFISSSTDPDGDSVSIRFYWGNGDTSDWSEFASSGDTVSASHAWQSLGTYQIRAQAKDEDGALSPWSGSLEFEVTLLKWRYQTGDKVYSSPAIGLDGTVYVGSFDGYLYALNPDGSLKWRYRTDSGIYYSTPAIGHDGTIYVGSYDGHLYAINNDGTLRWRFKTGSGIHCSSPAIAIDGTIYIGSRSNNLYAVNPDGTLKWRYQTEGWVGSSPAIGSDGTVYIGSYDQYLHAINPDGTVRWRYQTGYYITASSPAIATDGTIYIGSRDSYLHAVNQDGSLRWRYLTGNWIASSPAIGADGTVYVGSYDSHFYAINPDGSLRWQYQTGDWVTSPPATASNGTIYVGSMDGYLYAFNDDGALKWRYQTDNSARSSPAIGVDGTVYIGSYDGYIYAIHGDSPLADTPWPKFRHNLRNTGRVGEP